MILNGSSAGDLAELLGILRLSGGWTQQGLAERMGVSRDTVRRWERGDVLIPAHALVAWLDACGWTVQCVKAAARTRAAVVDPP